MADNVFPRPPEEPPPEQVLALITEIKDWQITHGSLLKLVRSEGDHTILSRPIGVALYPSRFPRTCFEDATELQSIYNELYARVATDEQWLERTLAALIEDDLLVAALWSVYQTVKHEGHVQDIVLGLFRSDYMLHVESGADDRESRLQLRQVEFNTFSCAGGVHGNRASDMHRHLNACDLYHSWNTTGIPMSLFYMPDNNTTNCLAAGLAAAHDAYGPSRLQPGQKTCVLFIVQDRNVNICDERPIEYALLHGSSPIPAYRVLFGEDVLDQTSVTATGELLYHPPMRGSLPALEVSVVYMRAGYDVNEYNHVGRQARLQLEKSRAIKCPSVLTHLATSKKVQQALTLPGAVEHFLSPEKASRIRETFGVIYPLDESELGMRGRMLATNVKTASDYILKPSREGGGHNVYRDAIPQFLESVPRSRWREYILMRVFNSPTQYNILMSPQGLYAGSVVSELGVFGSCMWRQSRGSRQPEIMVNEQAGWSLKSKAEHISEMSVVKGYGCFDSPCLV